MLWARSGGSRRRRAFHRPNFGFCLFERAWSLRRFDTFLVDLVLDPDFAEELLERITEIQLVLIRRFVELGVDGGYFGDDYGSQKGLLFSPPTGASCSSPAWPACSSLPRGRAAGADAFGRQHPRHPARLGRDWLTA